MNTSAIKRYSPQSAMVLVELALTLPLMLSLVYGCLEYSRILRVHQMLSSISREAANAGYRECEGLPEGDVGDPQSPGCLGPIHDVISEYAQSILPGSEIIISMYEYVPGSPDPDHDPAFVKLVGIRGIEHFSGVTPGPDHNRSRFTPGPLDPDHPDPPSDLIRSVPLDTYASGSLSATTHRIAIAEVFYKYSPATSVVLGFFKSFQSKMYEVTVL